MSWVTLMQGIGIIVGLGVAFYVGMCVCFHIFATFFGKRKKKGRRHG